MERGSNTLTDVIAGVTVQLNSTTASGSPATITASVDTDALKQQVQAFVSAYNTMVTFAQDKTSYDASTKTAGSLLGDYTVSSVLDQLQQPLIGPAAGFDNTKDAYTLASDIGLSLDQNGQLSLNTTTFDDAVSKNYAGVTSLLGATDTGASDSTNLSFYGARDSTAPGAYDVKATFADGVLSSAMIRKTGESDTAWRAATIKDGNLIIGAAGQPEQNLQVVGTYTGSGTVQSQVRVRQGIFGTLDDLIGNSVDSNIKSDEQGQTDQVNALQTSIDDEQTRITQYQADLTQQYAQLEATLSVLQGQKDAISAMTATSTTSS
jgi:flagellar hook-associated protein 2